MEKECHDEVYLEIPKEGKGLTVGAAIENLTEEQQEKLMPYLLARLQSDETRRRTRIRRYAKIDESISTWQKLSAEDSHREAVEDATGRQQAIPMTIPLAHAHVDDTVAFFSEVFAPVGGNFFAMPGKKSQNKQISSLQTAMQEDMKQSHYYYNVTRTMRSLCKYNVGGFTVRWDKETVADEFERNVLTTLDMYNTFWDPTVKDVTKLHSRGEWAAIAEIKNRIWVIREAEKNGLMNIDKITNDSPSDELSTGPKSYASGTARFYRNPPSETKVGSQGEDGHTKLGESEIDWDSFGLGINSDSISIEGIEVVTIWCFINPDQFGIESEQDAKSILELWEFKIASGKIIISAIRYPNATELPVYIGRVNADDMEDAARTMVEHMKPFQRFTSFLLNTHVDGVRSALWGIKAYDPTMFDISGLKNGEVSGILPSKIGGRDVRTGLVSLNMNPDTSNNVTMAGNVMELMKQIFPNQAMPSQIAGMDRAVSSQVSAVMQGAMRKMHMLARLLDSSLMLNTRNAMFFNFATYGRTRVQLDGIQPAEVANLLGSGLGQINREAAAESIRTLIFGLIQNPEGNQAYDVPGLFSLWSMLMNIGTDLGEFVRNQAPQGDPNQPPPADGQNGPTDPATQPTLPGMIG